MTRIDHHYTSLKYIIDGILVLISLLASSAITEQSFDHLLLLKSYFFPCIALFIWYAISGFSKLYADRRSNKYSEEIIFIIYTLILYTILLSSISFFLRNQFPLSSHFFGFFISILFLLLTFTKYVIRKYVHAAIFQGKLLDNILIIGASPAAKDFFETINKYYYYGYKCIGYLDNHQTKMNGCAYLGNLEQLGHLLAQNQIDEVVIALSNSESVVIQQTVKECEQYKIKTRIIPDFFQYSQPNVQVNNIGVLPVMNIRELPLDRSENRLIKRIFDIFFSIAFFLLIGWWLLPLIAITIKLNSKGPVFFLQERWGINNQKMTCYKFRSMVTNSQDLDEEGNYQQAVREDPRVTSIGQFLRKTNLDELPQFWNVLMGSMSVVGPRPHPTPLNLLSIETVDNYMLRHIVKPGITGWAQVNGARGETNWPGAMQQRVNFDLYYIHRWTFWLDLQIILQTIINIFRGDQNAY